MLFHNINRLLHSEYDCKRDTSWHQKCVEHRMTGLLYVCYFNFILFRGLEGEASFLFRV